MLTKYLCSFSPFNYNRFYTVRMRVLNTSIDEIEYITGKVIPTLLVSHNTFLISAVLCPILLLAVYRRYICL